MTSVAAKVAASELRVEIVGERLRAYDVAFLARVVAESFLPGVRATERHGICTSLIYRRRRVEIPGAAVAAPPANAAGRAETEVASRFRLSRTLCGSCCKQNASAE